MDRGSFSVECIFTLFGLKLLYPKHFYMSRGNKYEKKNYLNHMQIIPCNIVTVLRSRTWFIIIYVPADLACHIEWLSADLCPQPLIYWGKGEKLGNKCIKSLRYKIRIAREQGKQGIWMNIFPDRENAGILSKILKTFLQGIDIDPPRPFWSFKIKRCTTIVVGRSFDFQWWI